MRAGRSAAGQLTRGDRHHLRRLWLGCKGCGDPGVATGPGFLTLSTRIAGEVIQKFVTYGFQVAFVGDVSAAVAASNALRDFVCESNRGRHVWFVNDFDALTVHLHG